MPAITSLGIGSGLDINSMVTQLVALEKRPLAQMQAQASTLKTQVSSYGQLSSLFSNLQTASNALTNVNLWKQTTATSGDDKSVSVTTTTGAAAGSYAVRVQRLASSQTATSVTALASSSEPVGSGSLTLEIGRWNADQSDFTAGPTFTPVTLAVTAGDTLSSLRDKINELGSDVRATIITDANGARLSLRSTGTGSDAGFRITVNDGDGTHTDNSGLSRFATQPTGSSGGMAIQQPAQNALALVNQVPVESASNTLNGVIEGVSLRLRQPTATDVEISVGEDRDAVKKAVQAFADAYNALAANIATQTRFDANTKVGGPLQGDSAVTTLQRQLRGVLNAPSGASGTYARLSDIGLNQQRDGTLKVDETKLGAALQNLPELQKAFAASGSGDPANSGFARRYADLATQVLGVDGTLTTRTEGLRNRLTRNSTDQDKLNARAERFQARLVAQYTTMDGNLARLNSLSGYLTQQLGSLSKIYNSGEQ